MSLITNLSTVAELNALLNSPARKDKLVIIDFHATWCGPCHAIAPKYESMSKQYRAATFCKADVDEAKDIAQQYSIRAMPTFVFIKNGSKVDEVKGANASAIEAAIRRHTDGTAAGAPSFPGKGHSLVDGGTGQTDPPAEFGYVKVIVIVVLLYLWYSYANQGDSQKSA